MSLRTLETRPDVGLDIFQHMSQVDRAVGVGKGAGYKNSSFRFAHGVFDAAGFPAMIRIRNYGMTASQAVASAMQLSIEFYQHKFTILTWV